MMGARAVCLTREGSSGSGVRGEPSGEEGQLRSLALVTSPSARASNEGNPSSSTGMLSRVSVSTASKLASFSSSIFLGGGKRGKTDMEKQRDRKKIGHFSQEKLHLFFFFFQRSKGGGWLHAALSLLIEWEDFLFFFCAVAELALFWQPF